MALGVSTDGVREAAQRLGGLRPALRHGGSLFDIQIEYVYSIGVSDKEPAKADVLETLDIMILQTLASLSRSRNGIGR